MAKKRLSDLLREEGQDSGDQATPQSKAEQALKPGKSAKKPNDASAEPAPASKTADIKSVDKAIDALEAIDVTAEVIATQAERVEDFVADLRDAAVEPVAEQAQSAPANDLKETIAQLQADLAAAQKSARSKETEQNQEIERLHSQIATQSEQIQTLQTEMQQAEQQTERFKTELESARQMILQLSEVNKSSDEEASTAKPASLGKSASPARIESPARTEGPGRTASLPRPLPSSRAAEPELESTPSRMVIPAAKSAPDRPKLHELELRKVLDHPVRPASLPPMSSDALTTRSNKLTESLPPMSSDVLTTQVKRPPEKEMSLSEADVGWMD